MNLRVQHKNILDNELNTKLKTLNVSHSLASLKSKSLKKDNSSPYLNRTIKRQKSKQKSKNIGLKSSSLKNIDNNKKKISK